MKRITYNQIRAFRLTPRLSEQLRQLADQTNRHEADIIRQALLQYVTYFSAHPDELVKVAS